MAELLDLDAEVLHTYGSDVTAWLAERAGGRPPRRLLDLGSGTGTGTFALLKRFEEADATALTSPTGCCATCGTTRVSWA